jgi:AcrR family transcriptional regulator
MAKSEKPQRPGGDQRRDSLVRAAFACLAADGFEGLRTRHVADRAGVNIATLHYYFPTKEALIGGVAEFLATQFITLHAPAVTPTGSVALDGLHQEFADAYYYRAEHPNLAVVMFELQLRGRRDPAIRKVVEPLFGHWQHGIERWMTAGVAEGVFRSGLDPARAAALLAAAIAGASMLGTETQQLERIFTEVEAWLLAPAAAPKPDARRNAGSPSSRAAGERKSKR